MMSRLFLLLALSASCAQDASLEANPIRKIVTLMQDMQKEIEAEGAKEKVLYDDFMCFCKNGEGELTATAEGATAKISDTSSTLETDTAEKATVDQELIEHKADREAAKKDMEEAAAIRAKEKSEYEATAADAKANIEALSGAIPALEKGLGAASLMQMPQSNRLMKIASAVENLDSFDRESLTAFLQQKTGEGAPVFCCKKA